MQLQRGLSSVLRGAVFNFSTGSTLPRPSKRSTAIPKTRPRTIYSDGISKCCCCNSTWYNPSLHVSRNKGHDAVKAARLPEHGHQQNPRNRSYLINPNHPMQLATWSSLTHLNSIPAYSILTCTRSPDPWAVPPPPPTAILGWTSSRCLVGKTCTCHCFNGSTKGRLCTKLCQAVLCSEIVMNSVFEMNIAGYRYSYLCIFMQHSPHHPCIYC